MTLPRGTGCGAEGAAVAERAGVDGGEAVNPEAVIDPLPPFGSLSVIERSTSDVAPEVATVKARMTARLNGTPWAVPCPGWTPPG